MLGIFKGYEGIWKYKLQIYCGFYMNSKRRSNDTLNPKPSDDGSSNIMSYAGASQKPMPRGTPRDA